MLVGKMGRGESYRFLPGSSLRKEGGYSNISFRMISPGSSGSTLSA
jgi:hypothetical protein